MNSENQTHTEKQERTNVANEELLKQGIQLLRFIGRAMVVVGTQIQKVDEQNIKQFSAQKIQDIFKERE